MKTLDLNLYGVQEMNPQEMMETDGGVAWVPIVLLGLGAVYVIAETASYLINGNNSMQPGNHTRIKPMTPVAADTTSAQPKR